MNEHDALLGMLEEIARLAEQASLTGALDDGRGALVRRYNMILSKLNFGDGLFSQLPETAGMGEIAVEARMLLGAAGGRKGKRKDIQDDGLRLAIKLAPFAGEKNLAELVKQHIRTSARVDADALVALAPFIGEETLGDLMRSYAAPPEAPVAAEAPQTPQAPEPPAPRLDRRAEILRDLDNPHISPDQKMELALELAALSSRETGPSLPQ